MRVTNKMNHTKSPLITSPLFVMKKEIISLGKREPASMTDEEFEQRMLRILLKGFSLFEGVAFDDNVAKEFIYAQDQACCYVSQYVSDPLWQVGSINLIKALHLKN